MSHRVGSCLLQKELCIGLHMHIRKVDGALPLKNLGRYGTYRTRQRVILPS
jgi:hypothetical protein